MKKKKIVPKKVSKKTKFQHRLMGKSQEIVLRVEQSPSISSIKEADLMPTVEAGKYTIPKTWISEKQVLKIIQKTPPQHVYERPAKGGGKWKFVTGKYVEKVLNYVFGWNWDFEIMDHGKEGDQVWVKGKLTVKDDHGHMIVKSQFGRADIKYKKDTKIMLDFGNDLKSASTDALKKCASLLGIASDIYGKEEFKQEAGIVVQPDRTEIVPDHQEDHSHKEPVIKRNEDPEDYVCLGKGCGNDITKAEAEFSKKLYGKHLCRSCQKLTKENKK